MTFGSKFSSTFIDSREYSALKSWGALPLGSQNIVALHIHEIILKQDPHNFPEVKKTKWICESM
jgi:hypothetical protein